MAFQLVAGLWITPDFTEAEAGRREPPRVNHSKVNYPGLKTFLEELFPYGPRPRIQVANDTIDQVTIHMRQIPGAPSEPTMRCEDFGAALLKRAKSSDNEVLDVRAAWSKLHYLKDREMAPPPLLIPFVATFLDFEDAMIWSASCRPSLGLKPFDIMEALLDTVAEAQQEESGTLPDNARAQLEVLFGTPYLSPAILDRVAMDPPPAYARE